MLKNIDIAKLVDRVNRMIAASRERGGSNPSDIQARIALAILIEGVLHDSGRYIGFSYLSSEFIPLNERKAGESVLKPNYDDSARVYDVKPYRH